MKQATSIFLFMWLLLPAGPAAAFTFDLPDTAVQNLSVADLSKLVAAESSDAFCSGWGETKSQITNLIGEKNDRVADYLGGIVENLDDRRGVRDAKREGVRSEADQLRSAGYDSLELAAVTEDEKKAVEKYEERIEKALEERRAAVDATVGEYRKSIDILIAKRRMVMEASWAGFQSDVEAAFRGVDADCDADASVATMGKNLKSALSAARAKLEKDKQNALALEQQIKASAVVRRQSVAASIAAFQSEFKAANAELKAAFAAEETK